MSVYDSVLNQSFSTPWRVQSADSVSRFLLPSGVEARGHFLSDTTLWATPELVANHQNIGFPGWIYYLFFGLLSVFAVLRFYYPKTYKMIVRYLKNPLSVAEKENNERPGLMIVFFQFTAYLIDLGLLIFFLNKKGQWVQLHEQTFFYGLLFWGTVVFIYFILNQLLALVVGFLFDTSIATDIHVKMNSYMAYSQAFFLTPVLFFYIYTGWVILLYLAVSIVVVFSLFKWAQVVRVGLSRTGYTAFHLFLYLCTLEIIPVLLLIRVAILQV